MKNALQFSHELLKEVLQPGDIAVDATMGKGFDTLFLAEAVTKTGEVYAFDIQEQALIATKKRLSENLLPNHLKQVTLIQDSHENILHYVKEPIKGAIFNLGYLPTGDKSIITKKESTLKALQGLLSLLQKKGRIILVLYYGHSGGEEEKEAVLTFCQQLPQEQYSVCQYSFINQIHEPPILVAIEKA